jgi:hypothetical protein
VHVTSHPTAAALQQAADRKLASVLANEAADDE